jgi:hypothetical protein
MGHTAIKYAAAATRADVRHISVVQDGLVALIPFRWSGKRRDRKVVAL